MKRIITISVLVLCCFFFVNASFAQDVQVKGKVTDASTGETLIGVSIVVKGTTTGVQSDASGAFSISAPANATLVFTYIGYTALSVPVNSQTTLTVKMQTESKELQQVVVIGYGTQKKRDVTGAVASVKGDQLTRQPVQTPTQALQGKVAGVQILSSGQPNSAPIVRIRGTGSVLAGANPLYVVDGVLTDDIRNINNNDIVSVDVLKDASAAIYGVRAANGVIIITTKKGKSGAPVVSYDANVGFREIANPIQLANRQQYVDYLKVASPDKLADDKSPLTIPGTTDWTKAVSRNAFETNHNISVGGGSANATYFISANYIDEKGVIKTNNFQRFTIRANNEVNISQKLKFSDQLSLSRNAERPVDIDAIYGNVYRAAPIIPSILDGKYGNTSSWGNVGNPLLQLDKVNDFVLNNRVQGNVALDYNPIKSLTFHSAFNLDARFNNQKTYRYLFPSDGTTFTVGGGGQRQDNSSLFVQNDNSYQYQWDNTITFDQTFGQHHLTVLAGTVTEKGRSNFINGTRQDVPANPDQWFLDLGNPNINTIDHQNGDLFTRLSYVGRVNYGYGGRYLLSASVRRDGSSRFSEKYGTFYTVGAGWVLSEESFMKGGVFDNLKLRASYGELGNDNIGSSLFVTTGVPYLPYYFGTTLVAGTVIQDIKDANLKWETTDQLDIGLDYAFLNNRLSGEADYYNKKVKNALTNIGLPGILGDPDNKYITNAASYRNSGVEFSLRWNDKISSDISYNIGANISYNKNQVIGLSNTGQAISAGGANGQTITRTDNGQPVASYYVLKATGVFQNQQEIDNPSTPKNTFEPNVVGGLKYADISGPKGVPDGFIDAFDRVFAGSYQPKYFGGFNFGITYYNFDIAADFYGNWGNKIYNGKKNDRSNELDNIEASYANSRFTAAKPSSTDPAVITQATPPSTYFIESGAFLRLNNLTVGYTVPSALIKRAGISKLRFYITSQNLFTAKRYSGQSAELFTDDLLTQGIDATNYPVTRTFAFGVNLQF